MQNSMKPVSVHLPFHCRWITCPIVTSSRRLLFGCIKVSKRKEKPWPLVFVSLIRIRTKRKFNHHPLPNHHPGAEIKRGWKIQLYRVCPFGFSLSFPQSFLPLLVFVLLSWVCLSVYLFSTYVCVCVWVGGEGWRTSGPIEQPNAATRMSESKERVGSGFSSLEHSECLSLARCFSFIFLLFELPEYLLASFKAGSFAGSIFVCLPLTAERKQRQRERTKTILIKWILNCVFVDT